MKRLELTITALSPLAIGRQKPGGSISEAETYIPGTVVRGAIAAQILQQASQQHPHIRTTDLTQNTGGAENNDFHDLFLGDSPAVFHNAYPAIAKVGKASQDNPEQELARLVTDQVYVVPATAVSSKDEPGFKWEQDRDTPGKQPGGVFDTLIDRFCAEAYNQPYDPSCPKDCSRVEPFSGFYSKTSDAGIKHQYRSHAVSTRFLTRVGINRRRATAEDEILYSIEVLNESFLSKKGKRPQWESVAYRSSILIPDDLEALAERLKTYINQHSNNFRLGGSTSRGLGKVKITANEGQEVEDIATRIEVFNHTLRDRWDLWAGAPESDRLENQLYFTLDLQADAILTESWKRTTVISETMLQQFASITDSSLKLEGAYSSYDYRSGWNAGWGLMKDMELVTNKGAVYLFSVDKDRETEWIGALETLEEKGVGDRTCEGFGQVQICNEFHLVFREEPV
ncbi:MAG: CRISPR-associated RAMP protein Csx10 [Leptolyngbyaceae cyanobacterium SU_3_3]|nr:CRISPR-associated RAMP protein Csx10 [Leptolyngbyaceae cyanobacterium SU_3_3]